jgi:hypothetical protein
LLFDQDPSPASSFIYGSRPCHLLGHITRELITPAGYGHNESVFVGTFFKRFAQSGYVACKVVFLHRRVRPNQFHQLVLLHDSVAVLNQNQQDIEGLGGQWHWFATAQQQSPRGIDSEKTEIVKPVL